MSDGHNSYYIPLAQKQAKYETFLDVRSQTVQFQELMTSCNSTEIEQIEF